MVNNFDDALFELWKESFRKKNDEELLNSERRHWGIVHTDLEKVYAYYSAFLKPKPATEGDS